MRILDALCTRMPQDEEDFDTRPTALSVIRTFARLDAQQLFARRRLNAENFLQNPSNLYVIICPVLVQDEPSLKDMIDAHLIEKHRSEVRDMLQSILTRLSERSSTKAPVERGPVISPVALTASSTLVNVNEKGITPSQEGKGRAKEISASDAQEEPSASPAQFPAELETSPALGTANVFALTYTLANKPLRSQEHALSLLLADLNNIPSFGLDVARDARRAVWAAIARINQALDELEKGVEEQRGRANATVPVEQPAQLTHVNPSEQGNVTSADLAPIQVPSIDEVFTGVFTPAVPVAIL
ncbi:hypothetical protein EDB19DRAFT_1904591 [Suillus lakei]|nr:hypothetical protein EDB19DRAFT_1904591 [Suillus lakei]